MRLIDADALRKDLVETLRLCEQWMADAKDDETKVVSQANWFAFLEAKLRLDSAPTIDAVPVVRCKDCKWYDPPHIDHGGGKRTDVEDDSPHVPLSVGINVSGRCINTLREYCCNHDREDPDDYERLVKFRNRMDYCSDGERRDDE